MTAQRYLLSGPGSDSIFPGTLDGLTSALKLAAKISEKYEGLWSVSGHVKRQGLTLVEQFAEGVKCE